MQSIGADKTETILIEDGGANVPDMPGCTVIRGDGIRRGPAWARNQGWRARGHFILPLDADDYMMPRGAEHLLTAYATGRYGYIFGNTFTVERDGSYVLRGAPDYVQKDMAHYNIHVITALTPTKHWRAGGGMGRTRRRMGGLAAGIFASPSLASAATASTSRYSCTGCLKGIG